MIGLIKVLKMLFLDHQIHKRATLWSGGAAAHASRINRLKLFLCYYYYYYYPLGLV